MSKDELQCQVSLLLHLRPLWLTSVLSGRFNEVRRLHIAQYLCNIYVNIPSFCAQRQYRTILDFTKEQAKFKFVEVTFFKTSKDKEANRVTFAEVSRHEAQNMTTNQSCTTVNLLTVRLNITDQVLHCSIQY